MTPKTTFPKSLGISPAQLNRFIREALAEDIGRGDITTRLTVLPKERGRAKIIAKSSGVIAGLPIGAQVFKQFDRRLTVRLKKSDGAFVKSGTLIATIDGPLASILTAERVALNILQHLSGIATLTHQFVQKVKGTRAQIWDTRKTLPSWRALQKYAVQIGGGVNHRHGLHDQILIKENHIRAAGGVRAALAKAGRSRLPIQIEVTILSEAREAVSAGARALLCDNMSLPQLKKVVRSIRRLEKSYGNIWIEASGNMTLSRVRKVAQTGVDAISVGALTHSAPAMDFSLTLL